MRDKRIARYREKIEYIIEALEQIPEKPKKPIEISGTFYNTSLRKPRSSERGLGEVWEGEVGGALVL